MAASRGYDEILDILGAQSAIIPIGDPAYENAARTTVTTVGNGGGDGLVFTYPEAITAFDLPPYDMRTPYRVPVVRTNGTDEGGETPDAAFWTRVAGAFSIGAWVNLNAINVYNTILAKWDDDEAIQEWQLRHTINATFQIYLRDNSGPFVINRISSASPVVNRWYFVVATHDGAVGAAAANSINIYTDGVLTNGTATNNADYDGMEDGTSKPSLAYRRLPGEDLSGPFNGKLAGGPLGTFFTQEELSAIKVDRLHDIGLSYMKAGFPQRRRRGR